jgi:demethylmenaquinone methyltransferase/2-methoxy-6-polyprenyl-1,4-benzoquinol methylase
MSFDIDKGWRRRAIDTLRPFHPKKMMDVATGTGDFAILAARELKPDTLVGTDISQGMIDVGRTKVKEAALDSVISFACEDCSQLSFANSTFDAITVAFRCTQLLFSRQRAQRDVPCATSRRSTGHP